MENCYQDQYQSQDEEGIDSNPPPLHPSCLSAHGARWPQSSCSSTSSAFGFLPLFPSSGLFVKIASRLKVVPPSIQPLLQVLMPAEPRLLAANAKSISQSVRRLCSNILQTPPAKIFILYLGEMLKGNETKEGKSQAAAWWDLKQSTADHDWDYLLFYHIHLFWLKFSSTSLRTLRILYIYIHYILYSTWTHSFTHSILHFPTIPWIRLFISKSVVFCFVLL